MLRITLCLVIGLLTSTMSAQEGLPQDSLCVQQRTVCRDSLQQSSVSTPAIMSAVTLTAVSAMAIHNTWLVRQRDRSQDFLSALGLSKTGIDNYLQYSPIMLSYGLGALGLKSEYSMAERTERLGLSFAVMGLMVNTMKYSFREMRPDGSRRNSFPSGHTATAFMGAELLYLEYRHTAPLIAYTGFVAATLTGYLRIYNNRHYLNDVIGGACVGILSAQLADYLYPRVFHQSKSKAVPHLSFSPMTANGSLGAILAWKL